MEVANAKTVWKYPFSLAPKFQLIMPQGAQVIHAAMQHARPTLWATVDPLAPQRMRTFYVVGTGHGMPRDVALQHVGTVLDESYVWHIFEEV